MQHRKKYHSELVPMCSNFQSGNCEYLSCWFKHNENEEYMKDQDISTNIVDMMEKFAGRLSKIEQCVIEQQKTQEK